MGIFPNPNMRVLYKLGKCKMRANEVLAVLQAALLLSYNVTD